MGKGDRRSFRGKIAAGSHGKTRPHRPKPKGQQNKTLTAKKKPG